MLARAYVNESNREPRPTMKYPLTTQLSADALNHRLSCACLCNVQPIRHLVKGEAHV